MAGYRLRYMKGSFLQHEDIATLTTAMNRMAQLRAAGTCYGFVLLGPDDSLVMDEDQVHAFVLCRDRETELPGSLPN